MNYPERVYRVSICVSYGATATCWTSLLTSGWNLECLYEEWPPEVFIFSFRGPPTKRSFYLFKESCDEACLMSLQAVVARNVQRAVVRNKYPNGFLARLFHRQLSRIPFYCVLGNRKWSHDQPSCFTGSLAVANVRFWYGWGLELARWAWRPWRRSKAKKELEGWCSDENNF